MPLTLEDTLSRTWALDKWWQAWSSEDYIEWRRRFEETLDVSKPEQLAAIMLERQRTFIEKPITLRPMADQHGDSFEAFDAMCAMAIQAGWTIHDREDIFPQDIRCGHNLRRFLGNNAVHCAMARRPKTYRELHTL
jgi:hypothetical protein